jgi:hypothetical protein
MIRMMCKNFDISCRTVSATMEHVGEAERIPVVIPAGL